MPVLDNPQHEIYAQWRSKGKSQVEAYELAGYTISDSNHGYNASRLESENERVKQRIKELLDKAAELALVDNTWLLENFKKVAERCLTAEPVLDHEGEPTGEYRFEASGANKALENIGKHLGFFERDNEQKGTINLNIINYAGEDD